MAKSKLKTKPNAKPSPKPRPPALARPAGTCTGGVCEPQRTQGLVSSPGVGDHVLVALRGPGVFVGALVNKQGGNNDLTFIILDLDGRNVVNLSIAAIANLGLNQQNPFGLVLVQSGSGDTVTIGFPTPLLYARDLKLSVTVREVGVVQILANVIHGR